MKKIVAFLILLCSVLCVSGQNKNIQQIFDTYQHSEGVVSVSVAKPMFSLLNKLNINTDEKTINNLKGMLKGINSLRLLVVENGLLKELTDDLPLEKMQTEKLSVEKMKELAEQINKAVKEVNYMELITVNARGRSLKFMTAKSDGVVLDNLLLSISSSTEGNLLMFLDGKVNMDDVNKFIAAENE